MILSDSLLLTNVTVTKVRHPPMKQKAWRPLRPPQLTPNQVHAQAVINNENMTSGHYSRFFIQDPKPVYSIGDRIVVLIETRTDLNGPKTTGGDSIRAKMFSLGERAGQSTDGEVKDMGNGWYEAWFTARWPGVTSIEVVLVLTGEALAVLREIVANPAKMVYIGRFVNGDNAATTKCNIYPPQVRNLLTHVASINCLVSHSLFSDM